MPGSTGSTLSAHEADLEQPRPLRRGRLVDRVQQAILDDYIESGALSAGERLPPEMEISKRYSVSRGTVRAALRSLEVAGAISTRQGVGSTVLQRRSVIPWGLDRLCSVETFARSGPGQIDTANVQIDEGVPSKEVAAALEIEADTPVLVLQRTKLHDEVPAARIVDYVPHGVLPFDVLRREFDGSVLDVLLAHEELALDHADAEIAPVALDQDLARSLDVPAGAPALYMSEVTFTQEVTAVNYSCAWLLPEHFRFSLLRLGSTRSESTLDAASGPSMVAPPPDQEGHHAP